MSGLGSSRRLERALRAVLVAAVATPTSGCCGLFGRWVDADAFQRVIRAPPGAHAHADRSGELDERTCAGLCGEDARCFVATGFAKPLTPPAPPKGLRCNFYYRRAYGERHPGYATEVGATNLRTLDEQAFSEWTKRAGPKGEIDPETCFRTCAENADYTPREVDVTCALEGLTPATERPFADGDPLVVCHIGHAGHCATDLPAGRRTRGTGARRRTLPGTRGALFARVARAEAESVVAFERLARELEAFGAPRSLVLAAERAARDEARHAEVMSTLARREGARTRPVRSKALPERSLVDIALENAVEGCVGESFGALLAMHQARFATDPRARATLRRVARDEVGHAALSFRVHAWMVTRLGPKEVRRIDLAMARALRRIGEPSTFATPEVTHATGLPDPASSARLGRALRRRLEGQRV